jgi:hypothetical protein
MARKKQADVPVRASVVDAEVAPSATTGGFVLPCEECQGAGGHVQGCSKWEAPKPTRPKR